MNNFTKHSNMKKISNFLIFLSVFLILIMPALSYAYSAGDPLVPACTNCQWNDLMTLINNVISFVLFFMAVPIAAIMFAYAGILMVSSGGSTESRSKAKSIFSNVAIGLIIAIAAWLIVNTILTILGFDASWIGL
jgi:hypothetical protein